MFKTKVPRVVGQRQVTLVLMGVFSLLSTDFLNPGKSLKLSDPSFVYVQNRDNSSTFWCNSKDSTINLSYALTCIINVGLTHEKYE